MTPGRNAAMSASACSTSRSTVATPSGCLRSTATERRPRFSTSRVGSPAPGPGRSTRTTSAPMSASIMAVNGPGPMPAISITRRPCNGPMASTLPSAGDGATVPPMTSTTSMAEVAAAYAGGRARIPRLVTGLDDREAPPTLPGFTAPKFLATVADRDLPALALRAGDSEWVADGAGPVVSVSTDPFELLRALTGRRSTSQLRRLKWDGDPEPYLPAFEWGPFHVPAADIVE